MPKRNDVEELQARIGELEVAVGTLSEVLGTLVSWMAQSANSPIRPDEAKTLLDRLQHPDR